MSNRSQNISHLTENMDKLNEQEQRFLKLMLPNSGVLNVLGPPGGCKSAIFRSIANKLGFQLFDIRLPLIDETDVGLYPITNKIEDPTTGKNIVTLDYAVPRWAIEANKQPSIIVFDEFNRADESKRNAAMQILLERQIGTDFQFNNEVFMVALGNMGEEDGTNVEEFDTAMNNRLIHFNDFQLPISSWIEGFAKKNLHPVLVEFFEQGNEDILHQVPKDEDGEEGSGESNNAFPSHRSWTFLSDYIVTNYGRESEPSEWLEDVKREGVKFVGSNVHKFVKYCEQRKQYTLQDVVDNFDKIKNDLENAGRDIVTEIYYEARKKEESESEENSFFCSLNKKQVENYIKFMKLLDDDMKYNILDILPMIEEENGKKSNLDRVCEEFSDLIEKLENKDFEVNDEDE